MDGSDSVVQRLAKYTKGSWATFLNRASNVDINKKFRRFFRPRHGRRASKPGRHVHHHALYLELDQKESEKEVARRRRSMVDDEVEDTASFLYSIAKRGRKYYLGLATITQDAADFLKSPYGVPIITNSSIQLLLKQSPTTIDILQQTFNLTDEEKYLFTRVRSRGRHLFAGLKHVAIKIIASYTEDQIITSDRRANTFEPQSQRRPGSISNISRANATA